MATAFDLSSLSTAIKDGIEDQGSEFDSKLAELIQRAEDRCLLDLQLEIFDAWDAITFTNGVRTATLPSGFLDVRKLYYVSSGSASFLDERTADYLLDFWPAAAATTTAPRFWAPYSETQIIVAGTPGATPTGGQANGTKRPTSLVDAASGTWLSTNVGSLLLHSCLIEAHKHAVADERIALWKGEYADLLAKAQKQFAHLLRRD